MINNDERGKAMMRPISRIPKADSGNSLESMIAAEMDSGIPFPNSWNALRELLEHDANANSIQDCLDWAMEIRDSQGIDWGTAISLAMTFYYG